MNLNSDEDKQPNSLLFLVFLFASLIHFLFVHLRRSAEYLQVQNYSVSDPSQFDVDPDPDPGIHIWEKWIRILGSTFP